MRAKVILEYPRPRGKWRLFGGLPCFHPSPVLHVALLDQWCVRFAKDGGRILWEKFAIVHQRLLKTNLQVLGKENQKRWNQLHLRAAQKEANRSQPGKLQVDFYL